MTISFSSPGGPCASIEEAIARLEGYGVVVVMDAKGLRALRDLDGGLMLVIRDEALNAADKLTELTAQAESLELAFIRLELCKPKRTRTHPNEPFYRGLKKHRGAW